MDGIHDMGGMHGFGTIPYERNQPTFHHDWERRVWGLKFGTTFPDFMNLDYARHSLERMPPDLYVSYSYFERFLYAITTTLLSGGLITLEEVQNGKAAPGSAPRTDAAAPESIDPYSHPGFRRETDAEPLFKIGDRVRTGNSHPSGHMRLPRYARDKVGQIHLHHGAQVLPDTNAHGKGESPTHLYTVAFSARALWGAEASAKDKVFLDIQECHLELV